MEIINIAVDERMHGRGIGKKLMSDAIQTAKVLGLQVPGSWDGKFQHWSIGVLSEMRVSYRWCNKRLFR